MTLRSRVKLLRPLFRGPRVFVYHDISAKTSPSLLHQGITLSPRTFEDQVRFFAESCSCIPFQDIPSHLDNPNAIALTFDDGCLSFLTESLPILEQYNVPAKLFLTRQNIEEGTNWLCQQSALWSVLDKKSRCQFAYEATGIRPPLFKSTPFSHLWSYFSYPRTIDVLHEWFEKKWRAPLPREFMSYDDLQKILNHELLSFGSHTHHHYPLTKINPEMQRGEIVETHRYLENRLGQLQDFAIPFGTQEFVTPKVKQLVQEINSPVISAYGTLLGRHVIEDGSHVIRHSVEYH